MRKFFLSSALSLLLLGQGVAGETPLIGVVNFTTCVTDSKAGKKEQETLETLRKQMASLMEDTDKELREIAAKFDDPEYLDTLSPKAEEELKTQFQTRQEDLARYQNQFYQVMNQAQMHMLQKLHHSIAQAAEFVAQDKRLDYVINKEACFYIRSDFDVTNQVIATMDRSFDLESKRLTEGTDALPALEESNQRG